MSDSDLAGSSSAASAPRLAQTYAEVEDALLSRWPETRIDPTLDRIRDFLALLGDPQDGYPVVHLTGTNGKTSTARMIEALVRALGLRTGRFTSPHLESMTERIVVDGEPLSEDQFVAAFNDIAPYTHLVDAQHSHPLSFFETITAMAYATFADAPVDAAVVEVGLGGTWDSTNVADGKVAVITPIAVDHDPLRHRLQVRAGEPARAQPERPHQALDHPRRRRLAVGTGQVHDRVAVLGVAEQPEEVPDPVQRGVDPSLRPP